MVPSVFIEAYTCSRAAVRAPAITDEFWDFCESIVEIVCRLKISLDNFAYVW